ncbi:unnamed protein product [Closterium sp. NIES-54]
MASLRVLEFGHEGRPVQIGRWLDDLKLYLLSDNKDSISLFDHVSGATTAPPATADSATRSHWLSRDAAARLAIRNHLPLAECAHFGQHRTAQALYDAVVARYSSPATATLGHLLLPYLFPELSAFATLEDLVSHLRTSDARYRAVAPAEFLNRNQPPMFITLYFIVTRLPDSLRSVRDHFLSLDPTSLTVDLLEQHLLAAETSAVAVGAARGTPRQPFFEGCSPSPLAPSYASAAAAHVSVAEDVGAASASGKRRSSKGKGGRGGGGGSDGGGGGSGGSGGGSSGGGGSGGTCGGSGGSGGGVGGSGGSGGSGGGGTGGGGTGARCRGASGGSCSCPYVIRTGDRAGQTCGRLQTRHRCFSRLDDAWRAEFGDDAELPRWADILRSRIAIFDLDFDAILSTMYALSVSAEGDCYRSVPPDPGIAAVALGATESGTLPGTALAQALHTFMMDSGASACFFRGSTILTPLSTPVPVRLADPSGGPVVARSSTILPCPAAPSDSLSGLHLPSFSANLVSTAVLLDAMVTTTTPGGQRVSICTCTRTGRHLATFTRRPGSSLYTLATEPPQVAAPLPPPPPSPAPPCLPCVKGWQRAAPHTSSFPPTTAPPQTLHMDVWGPTCVSGQSCECYFLLVVDDYTRYTTVFPLCSKGQVVDVLIPWIRTVRLQLRKCFSQDLPVLCLHSDRGGEFSSKLLRDFCRGEGILQSLTIPDSPQQNGIAERRIGLVMEPRVSLPETSPTLCWTGEVGDASVFRVWGSRAFVRDTSADKVSPRAIPCVFLGFVPDAPSWQFYHPTSRRVFPSQYITFDESVPFYRLFPYRSAPPPPPPLFLAPGPPSVDPFPPQGPAPSNPEGDEPEGAASEGAEFGGAEPQDAASSGGSAGASPRQSLKQLHEWFVWRARLRSGATGAGGARAAGARGAGVAARAVVTGVSSTIGPGGACTWGTKAAGSGGVEGAGARDPTESRATSAGGSGARGAGAGGAGPASPLPTQWSLRRLVYGLRQAPHEWHDTLRTTLAALGLAPSTADPSLLIRTDTLLPPFYVLVYVDDIVFATADTEALTLVKSELQRRHTCTDLGPSVLRLPALLATTNSSVYQPSLSAPPSDESVEPSGPYPKLVGCLMHQKVHWDAAKRVLRYLCSTSSMGLVLGGQGPVVLTGHADASWDMTTLLASAKVSASRQVAASCSCCLLSHQTLLWHHRLGHPSPPRLRGMHSRLLVSGLPRSLPPLPPSPAPPCLPCVEGRQRAAPHSSSFPPTNAPLQSLHMDVWGPTRVSGQGRERYFLLVVVYYTRYTTVFLLRSKGEVSDVLIPWIRTVHLQLHERFSQDLPILRLHYDIGGEFSSNLLREFCRGEGILQSFTIPASPQQNGIAGRRIGLVMEVARTSIIHAAAPHFLLPFVVWYAAHQLNLWPRVSLTETSPTLRWTGKVGDASVFRVRGSHAFVRDTSADKLSACAILCVFLGFAPNAPGWQFYHPTLRRVFPSQDVKFEESVPLNHLFPYCSAPPPPPSLFLAHGPPPVDPLPGTVPVQVAVALGAAPGAASGGAASGGVELGGAESEGAGSGGGEPGGEEPGGAEPAGVETGGVEPGGAESEGLESGVAEPRGAASSGGLAGALPGTGAAGTGGVEGAGAGDPMEPSAARAGGTGAGAARAGGAGAAVAGAVDPGAGGTGDTVRPRPYFVPLLQQVLGVPSSTGLTPPLLCPPPDQTQLPMQPASPLPAHSPYTEQSGGLTERHEPASRSVSHVRTARHVPRSRPLLVPGTHAMALRPSFVPLRVPLPPPPESSLPEVLDPESDRARAASPAVARLLTTAVPNPESAAAFALVAKLLDFAAACRLDYAIALVAKSASACPPSVGGECTLGTDILEDRQEDFECLAAAVPRFTSMLLAPEGDPDAPEIPTPRSYAEAITDPYSS